MIKAETLEFLKGVSQHNDREWFAEHKAHYESARQNVLDLISQLLPEISKIDPLISAETDPKKCIMRIYRDVRFSKNKDPYKTNFGVWFSANGKGGNEPGYYLHLQPDNSFLAGGYWMPEASHLKLIRQEIDYNNADFLEIIHEESFASQFVLSEENKLKKAPKGYDPEDPHIELLKLKSFEVIKALSDQELFHKAIATQITASFKIIYPLVAFLRQAIAK